MVGFCCFCGLGVVPRRSSSFSGDGFRWYWFRVFCVVKVFGIGGGLVVMVFVGGGSGRGSVVVEATRCCVGTSGGGNKGLLVLVWMGVDGWGLVQGWSGRRRGGLWSKPNAKADSKAADNRLKRKGAGIGRKQTNKAAKDLNKPNRLS
ncbi:hypothetical protein P8452_20574 [Trifolium repens]|nr:hypothetical protein P8452_20574 [Trifolium repens]